MNNATVIAYRTFNGKDLQYVSDLPGHGGKDWGYTTDASKAQAISVTQAKRFLAMCEHVGCAWFGTRPAL